MWDETTNQYFVKGFIQVLDGKNTLLFVISYEQIVV